jgi:glycogen debranching enzyme
MLPQSSPDGQKIFLAYRGVDGMMLETIIEFFGCKPNKVVDGAAIFQLRLPVRQPIELELCVDTIWGGNSLNADQPKLGFHNSQTAINEEYSQWIGQLASISTDNPLVNLSIERSFNDIFILRQSTPKGFGLAAGIPWYCTIFGRDSAITGLQILPFMPEIAKECIEVLAAYQGQSTNSYTAEQPGRIMHEIRFGEMARAHQIPHTPYYGTVDATELWLLLFCEYVKWTGDLEFAANLWPAVKLALGWLHKTMEAGNGYLRYHAVGKHGLENQGWKDSSDSIMYSDGSLATPPIAVCEAQSYLYASYQEVAKIATLLGHTNMTKQLEAAAESLKARFRRDFWMESEKYVCLALDGENKQANVISSNAGHCLFTDILDSEKAQLVADKLMDSDLHSGWGVRTLSANAVAFSPISYHNGSVWLHDNAIVGEGMRRIGRTEDMKKIMHGILDVSFNYPDNRLPELFCGFDRVGSYSPVSYPVSCSPQAWAAGSLLQMIKTCINFQPDAVNNCIRIVEPALPEWLGKLTIKGLKVGKAQIDLAFDTSNGSTVCQILRKSGNVRIIVET